MQRSLQWQFTRFLLPLVLTALALEFGGQVLNGGMARVPSATATLASFGLAWALINFIASPMAKVKQLSLVLVQDAQSRRQVLNFVTVGGTLLSILPLAIALTGFGHLIIDQLHDVEPHIGQMVRSALLWMAPIPLLRTLAYFYAGILIRKRRTDIVSYAMLISIGASIAAVFALLPTRWVESQPILLPLIATYANVLVELAIVYWGCLRHGDFAAAANPSTRALTFGVILNFYWPLALIIIIQEMSRPLINLFIARESNSTEALAVLTIVYALGHLPYGWLNDLVNLAPTFQHEPNSRRAIQRFTAGCTALSFAAMLVCFWSPLRDYILQTLLGLDAAFAELCRVPLYIFSFFTFPVAIRAFLHGEGLLRQRTSIMAPSAPARILAILTALVVLPLLGVTGADRGVAALLSGFVVETIAVWWGLYAPKREVRYVGQAF